MDKKKIFLILYNRPYIEKTLEMIDKTTLITVENHVYRDIHKINDIIKEVQYNGQYEDMYTLFKIAKRAIIFAHSSSFEEAAAHIFYKLWITFSPEFSKFVVNEGAYDPFFLRATKDIVSLLHDEAF